MEGNPTHVYLTEVNGYLNACSASVHSNLVNGVAVYLAITAQPAGFDLVCPNVFNTPANPGATLILSDTPPMAAIIKVQTLAHAKELRIFNEYYNVKKSCKKIIFTLIPKEYYRSFKNKHTGFETVFCLTILTHLWMTYGTLQDFEVQENYKIMKKPITSETIFEDFVEQIEVLVDAIATQVPYTPERIFSIAFTLVEKSVVYYDDAKEWLRKPAIDKTWDNFKDFFAREFHEVCVIPRTAQAAGYAQICADTGQANTAVHEQIEQTHAQALVNLAITTTANRQAVVMIYTTNATITAELRAATTLITNLQLQLTLNTDASLPPPATLTPRACVPIGTNGYCWSHGYCVRTLQNGRMCNSTVPGHQRDATCNNHMGIITKNKLE